MAAAAAGAATGSGKLKWVACHCRTTTVADTKETRI